MAMITAPLGLVALLLLPYGTFTRGLFLLVMKGRCSVLSKNVDTSDCGIKTKSLPMFVETLTWRQRPSPTLAKVGEPWNI